MANPQVENGHTRIANEIIEQIALLPLNGTQFRITLIVWRYTYGFSRKEHDLSETFISKACGIHKKQVQRELNELINFKIINVIKEATFNSSRILSFNKNYDSWEVTKKLPGSQKDTHTGSELVTSTGSGLVPQERNNKTNIKERDIDKTIQEINDKSFEFGMNGISYEFQMDCEQRLSEGIDKGLILKALSIGATKASGSSASKCKYAMSILKNYASKGIKSLKELEPLEQKKVKQFKDNTPQRGNFEQRQYDDSFYDSVYEAFDNGKSNKDKSNVSGL